MILDTIIYNLTNTIIISVITNIYYLNNKRLFLILITDIIINKYPFITITIILLYYLNKNIFKYLSNKFITKYILLIIYYFIFGITIYSIYNKFNFYIIEVLFNNLIYNAIFLYLVLKLKNKNNIK